MAITPKAREALEQAFYYESKEDWDLAELHFRIAAREKALAGGRGLERVQKKKGLGDVIDSKAFAKRIQESNTPIEKPKMTAPLSIPSEETRILIEERKTPQQKPKTQQKKTEEKPKPENSQGNNVEELLKKAQELETKGKKKESFLLLKKAADCGSERAKAELGQKYLKLAIKYLGRDVAFEKLGAKVTSSRKDDKTETSTALKPHFRHQRNRIADLNGCGDMAETETSVLHAEQAEETTWVGEEKKDNPPPPEVIIQEIVRYVAYWSGTDCLPNLMFVDCPEPELWKCTMKSGQEFSETSVMMLVDCTAVTRKEEAPLPMPSEEKQKEQASKPSIKDSFYRVFRNIFTIFKR